MSEHKHVIKFDVKTYPCECGLEFSQELAETLVEAALRGSLPTVQLGIDLEFEKRRVAELEAAQRWIPVSERLPKENAPVLVLTVLGGMFVDFIHGKSVVTGNPDFYELDIEDVTHWMPLPKPPEVK